jgi:hypothetical protein
MSRVIFKFKEGIENYKLDIEAFSKDSEILYIFIVSATFASIVTVWVLLAILTGSI